MELGLAKRKESFGIDSQELLHACKKVGETCNDLALKCIDEENFEFALKYLKRGMNMAKHDPQVLQITLNNMALLYKNIGNLKVALRYFIMVLDLESKKADGDNLKRAQIHLNICAIGSQLGKYKMASRQAESAIKLLKDHLNQSFNESISMNFEQRSNTARSNSSRSLGLIKEDDSHDIEEDGDDETQFSRIDDNTSKEILSTLAIAYYNAGAVQEHLKKYNLSYHYYQLGLRFALHHLCESDALVKALEAATTSISKRIVRNNTLLRTE